MPGTAARWPFPRVPDNKALSAVPLFWTIAPVLFGTAGTAGGIAVISSIGHLAGVASQAMVGTIKAATGSLYLAFDVIGAVLVFGTLLLLIAIPARSLNERRKP